MRIIIACEVSGKVRDAFRRRGHDAWSCDLKPSNSPFHIQGDIFNFIKGDGWDRHPWDMMICHPPCTYLSSSGLHWNGRTPGRQKLTGEAVEFARKLFDSDIPLIGMENPIGCLSTKIREPDQIIQPYQFGHDASKATCLWLKGLPPLKHTKFIEPRIVWIDGKPYMRWANQTDSGQNKLTPTKDPEDRRAARAETYDGIADAMAEQWSSLPGNTLPSGDPEHHVQSLTAVPQ